MATNRNQIVPYVVPPAYPQAAEGCSRLLGHGVRVLLAVRHAALVRNLGSDEIAQLGSSTEECWQAALANIEQVFAEQMKAHFFPAESPDVVDLILCGASWLAASCIVMPSLYTWATKALRGELLVSIPNPEALLIFPKGTAAQRAAMRAKIRNAEATHRKPITWELFELSAAGIQPFPEPA